MSPETKQYPRPEELTYSVEFRVLGREPDGTQSWQYGLTEWTYDPSSPDAVSIVFCNSRVANEIAEGDVSPSKPEPWVIGRDLLIDLLDPNGDGGSGIGDIRFALDPMLKHEVIMRRLSVDHLTEEIFYLPIANLRAFLEKTVECFDPHNPDDERRREAVYEQAIDALLVRIAAGIRRRPPKPQD